MTQLPTLVPYAGVIPDKFTQSARDFANAVHPFMKFYHTDTVPQINDFTGKMNTLAVEIEDTAAQVASDKVYVEEIKTYVNDAINYKGEYDSTVTYALSDSVTLDNLLYISKIDNNTAAIVPYESTAEWLFRGTVQKQIVTTSTDYTAANNLIIGVDTSSSQVTITLPSAPVDGDSVEVMDIASMFSANPLTIARNGQTIMGLAEDMVVDTDNVSLTLLYINNDWRLK